MISVRTELDTVTAPGRGLSHVVRQEWVDRLVDLRILATHGDPGAAARAADWVAHDAEARLVWDALSSVGECFLDRRAA